MNCRYLEIRELEEAENVEKHVCMKGCIYTAWEFHQWLQKKGFLIFRVPREMSLKYLTELFEPLRNTRAGRVKDNLLMINTKKEIAKKLLKDGFDEKEVSELLDINIHTFSIWMKEQKEL